MLPACASDLKEKSCKASGAKVKICWNKRTPTVSVPKLAALLQVSSTKCTSTFVKGSVAFAWISSSVKEGAHTLMAETIVVATMFHTLDHANFTSGVKASPKPSRKVIINALPTTSK